MANHCDTALIATGITNLQTNNARWSRNMHDGAGNIALGDGNVQQLSENGLRQHLAQTATKAIAC